MVLIMAVGMQVEGAFMQGMGWTCIEELVWGDEQHKWVKPGVLHTRGPGVEKILPLSMLLARNSDCRICGISLQM